MAVDSSQSPAGHIPSRREVSVRRLARNASPRTVTTTIGGSRDSALVASAAVLTSSKIKRLKGVSPTSSEQWQHVAWHYYDVTPELAYTTRFEANAISRAVLTAARLPDKPDQSPVILYDQDDDSPIVPADPDDPDAPAVASPEHMSPTDRIAASAMAEFLGGRVEQSQEIARVDTHLMVAGISHIVLWDDAETGRRIWTTLSNEEISHTGNGWRMVIDGEQVHMPEDDVVVIRVWTPHGRNRWQPDSPVRHLLPVLSELEGLTKHVSANIDSRLAGNGLLVLPQEISFPHDPEKVPEGEDPFLYSLVQNMSVPINDRDSAASVVPMVLRVAGEYVDKIQHITFSSDLDEQTKELREEAVRRVALGLDIPPEILLGLADSNHWTSWQIEESSIKLHIEPKLQLICHAATVGYLQPYLKAMGVTDWDRYVCWYDVTQIKLRPNRAADAKDLHADLLITDEARRKAAGFDEADAPTKTELGEMAVRRIITDAPQLALQLLRRYGIEVDVPDDQSAQDRQYEPGMDDSVPTNADGDPAQPNNNPSTSADDPTPGTRPSNISRPPDGRPGVTTDSARTSRGTR